MKGFPADFRPKFGRKIDIRLEIEKKIKKKRFFRFFQKLSKSSVNIEFCLKNTLNTPRGQFLPIFHHISQYKPGSGMRMRSNADAVCGCGRMRIPSLTAAEICNPQKLG